MERKVSADKFKECRDRYGAIKIETQWEKEMIAALRDAHGAYVSRRDGFVSLAIGLYDIEAVGKEIVKDYLLLYQSRFTSGASGAKGDERQRKIRFHLALVSARRIVQMRTIETPHGIIRRWLEEGKSPLYLLETREPGAKTF